MSDRASNQLRLTLQSGPSAAPSPIVRSNITSALLQQQQQLQGTRNLVATLGANGAFGNPVTFGSQNPSVINTSQPPSTKQLSAAKTRMSELLQFWLSLPETGQRVKTLIEEVAQHARKDGDPSPPWTAKAVANPRQAFDVKHDNETMPSVGMDDLPSDLGGFTLSTAMKHQPRSPNAKLSVGKITTDEDDLALEPPLEQQPSATVELVAPKGPKQKVSLLKSPRGHSQGNYLSPNVTHVVDEMDAAHRQGALSPRAVSPNPLMDSRDAQPYHAKSPLDRPLGSSPAPSFELSRSGNSPTATPHESVLDLEGTKSRESPRAPLTTKPVTAANVAAVSSNHDRLTSQHRSTSSLSTNSSNGAANTVAAPPTKVPVASLDHIPRFFFEKGRPVDLGESLVDHLNLSKPAPAELKNVGSAPARGIGWKPPIASTQTTTAADQCNGSNAEKRWTPAQEEQELQSLSRIFQMLQQQAAPKSKNVRAPSAGRRPGTSKPELSPLQAMAQITTTVFGLPSLFTKLLGAKIAPKGSSLVQTTVKQYYDQFMARRTQNRRMFESLIGAGAASAMSQPSASPAQVQQSQALLIQAQQRNFLIRDDFVPLVKVLLDHHPGLAFLKEAADFQSKYLETVILRIFYDLDPLDSGRISWERFNHSLLPRALCHVDSCEDINEVLDFFSYEHFYVLYCRFWELDTDKDFLISLQDLERYFPENTTNSAVIERIFAGYGRKPTSKVKGKINYEDFVYFCLSEENKAAPRAIRYWFRVLDLDGDGVISGFELEQFYNHTRSKLLQLTSEAIGFQDVMCQVCDMLSFAKKPQEQTLHPSPGAPRPPKGQPGRPPTQQGTKHLPVSLGNLRPHTAGLSLDAGFTLGDFLRCPQAAFVAFNMLTNVSKFVQFEQRDPFVAQSEKQQGVVEKSEWDRFCRSEYDRMAAEADDGGEPA